MHLKLSLTLLLLLPLLSSGLQFTSNIKPAKTRCFYQILNSNQKYRFDIYPTANPSYPDSTYDISIEFMQPQKQRWQTFYLRQGTLQSNQLNIHKLATLSSTYKFCVTNNNHQDVMPYSLTIQTGMQLMELHLLPDKSDADNMILLMEWIQQETNRLRDLLTRSNGGRQQIQSLSSLTSTKIIIAVLIFTVAVFVLNGVFYSKIKRGLHQRKII